MPEFDTAEALVAALDELGHTYGALGVAKAAADLTDRDVLVRQLTHEPTEGDQRPLEASPHPPSIGRVVHYVSYGTPGGEYTSECRAALITEVSDNIGDHVGLFVANPTGLFLNRNVPYSERSEGGSWHWPERVDG